MKGFWIQTPVGTTYLSDRVNIGSCFLFVGEHALCLQGVKCYSAASWTITWWREEVQVVAEESGNLQENGNKMCNFIHPNSIVADSLAD